MNNHMDGGPNERVRKDWVGAGRTQEFSFGHVLD